MKLLNQEQLTGNFAATTPVLSVDNQNTTSNTTIYFIEALNNGSDAFILRRQVNASGGFTDFRIIGITNAPAIASLIAPNGTDYADWTFDGSNTELESSIGDINLRPNLNGVTDYTGNVNIWSPTHTPKLRVGNKGFTQAIDLYHDGTDAHLVTTGGKIILAPAGSINIPSGAGTGKVLTSDSSGNATWQSPTTGITRSVNSISANTTAGSAASTDYVYFVSGTTTLTLPTAVGNTNLYTVKNTGVATVTIATTSSQTIDGSSTATLSVPNTSLDLVSDGSNWRIV